MMRVIICMFGCLQKMQGIETPVGEDPSAEMAIPMMEDEVIPLTLSPLVLDTPSRDLDSSPERAEVSFPSFSDSY